MAHGKSAAEAYEAAGFKPNDGNAARLKGNDRVQARVAELQSVAAGAVEVTLESLIRECEDARRKAMAEEKGASAAVSAITAKAKLAGLWIERSERTNRNIDASDLTDEELADIVRQGSRGDAEAPRRKSEPDRVH